MCFIQLLDSSSEAMKVEKLADILVKHIVLGMNIEIFYFLIPIIAHMTSNL